MVAAALAVINRMEDSVKLTDTQLVLLSAASQRDDRALERPSNLTGSAAEVTPVGEIVGQYGDYRFTPGAICRLMSEDYDRAVGKQIVRVAAE